MCMARNPRSLPVRERGLKFDVFASMYPPTVSLPVRERGLKFHANRTNVIVSHVAPRAGAWIEIFTHIHVTAYVDVAPRAGAWIEITESSIS